MDRVRVKGIGRKGGKVEIETKGLQHQEWEGESSEGMR
jgi:hypothetical protein